MTYQPHTFLGLRGDTTLGDTQDHAPLTYRDVYEAVLVGLNRSGMQPDDGDVYKLDLPDIDPVAVAQNTCVVLEERAGIYPNINKKGTT